jgi:hypothetical protein
LTFAKCRIVWINENQFFPIIIKYAPSGSAWIEPNVLDFGRVDQSNLPVTLKFRLMRDIIHSSSEPLFSENITVTCDDNNIQLIPIETDKTDEERNFSKRKRSIINITKNSPTSCKPVKISSKM